MRRTAQEHLGFEQIADDVWQTIVEATNNYGLLTELLFPIAKQRLLWRHYPFVVETLLKTVSRQVLSDVCRLFDPKRDSRQASLATLLRGVGSHHAIDRHVGSQQREPRAVFEREVPARLNAINARWKSLVIHRNAYLAHRDLTKLDALPEIKYRDVREAIEWAQALYAAYAAAYRSEAPGWRLLELYREPAKFLKWCRLDDYQKHYGTEQQAQKISAKTTSREEPN